MKDNGPRLNIFMQKWQILNEVKIQAQIECMFIQ